ncbi:hypothetical protein ZWY2020_025904 [Hordeum vulgare]|nr:hypothetical protein ZWY2020_025904 [Hordeum vulgare]
MGSARKASVTPRMGSLGVGSTWSRSDAMARAGSMGGAPRQTDRGGRAAVQRHGGLRGRRLHRASRLGPWTAQAMSGAEPSAGGDDASEIIDAVEVEPSNPGASFLAKVAVAMGVAVTVTAISIFVKQPSFGPSFSLPQIIDASAQSDTVGYTFSQFGKKVIIPEYTPGNK